MGEGERVDSFPSQPTLSITHPSIYSLPCLSLVYFLSLDDQRMRQIEGKDDWMDGSLRFYLSFLFFINLHFSICCNDNERRNWPFGLFFPHHLNHWPRGTREGLFFSCISFLFLSLPHLVLHQLPSEEMDEIVRIEKGMDWWHLRVLEGTGDSYLISDVERRWATIITHPFPYLSYALSSHLLQY